MGKKPQESKTERMNRVVENSMKAPVAKPEDQKSVPAQAQATSEKTKKKESNTVVAWKAMLKTPPADTAKISLIKKVADQPKKRAAAARYALYEDGMTVGAYIEKSHKAGNPKSLARRDVCWDIASGFIAVA